MKNSARQPQETPAVRFAQSLSALPWSPTPLTQVGHPCQSGVKADLLDFVRAGQEEVDDAVGHNAVGESLDGVVEAPPHVKAVPVVLARFNGDGLPVGGGVPCDLSDGPSHLGRSGRHPRRDI